ncbi:MAG TPA: SdiA-regulated domain-containing protein, partial [Gemmatimonadaceae bacterium]|nr:SdiA-regulated domain-containing protein [Gemmatimonadaceae bacterium]
KECEFESMVYEADSSRLVLVCKKIRGKNAPHELLIHRFPLPLDVATMSTLRVPIADVIGSNKWKGFHPSDINIDPVTKNYVIIASREKGLLVLTPEGHVVRSEPLPGDHRQPEGVAITNDSILIISDEANGEPPAITLYRWRR